MQGTRKLPPGQEQKGRFRFAAASEEDARRFGVALRKSLLDDTAGMALVAVKIDGLVHEFQGVPGVREDAVELIGKLKRVRLIAAADTVTGTLDTTNPTVTAEEIRLSSGKVADPQAVIAHLAPSARLSAQVIFRRGRGYSPEPDVPEGFIPVGAHFNPVTLVSTSVKTDSVEITIQSDGSISPETALREAVQLTGESVEFETLPLEPEPQRPKVELGPEFFRDPFNGVEPPSMLETFTASYKRFLSEGIGSLLDMLFPIVGGVTEWKADRPRLDLIEYRIVLPDETPRECLRRGGTHEGRLILKVRWSKNLGQPAHSYTPPQVSEQEVDMGTFPLMTDDGDFIWNGHYRAGVVSGDDLRTEPLGEFLLTGLKDLISRMKPVLEDHLALNPEWPSPFEVLNLLPFTAALTRLITTKPYFQYRDETNLLAALTHKLRVVSKALGSKESETLEEGKLLTQGHFGRLSYLETPEGPNAGFIHSTCLYTRAAEDGTLLTPYRRVEDGSVVYLTPEEEKAYVIADWDAIGADGKIKNRDTLVRDGEDMRMARPEEVQLTAVSPVQNLSPSGSLLPFMGNNDPMRVLMAVNMQRQAVPLINPAPPMVVTGTEGRIAAESGLLRADRDGEVLEVTSERIVVLSGSEKQIYPLAKFRRTNQATCWNDTPIVFAGQRVKEGDVLADAGGSCSGSMALGKDVLVAYMPFKGYNFEDALCISDELVHEDAFTSIHLENFWVETQEKDVWIAPAGTRVEHEDALVQESGGKKRVLLISGWRSSSTVVDSKVENGIAHLTLAQKRNVNIGDKFAGRHGNKGVVARILPRSEMPHLADGTPVQMVINTLGVFSRMNLGQILETHYGALAHALGVRLTIPPFCTPEVSLLKAKLAEAGLGEDGMTTLYDGETGRPFESPVTVGYLHMMKLAHLVLDKLAAVSTSVPSILTGQPTGRANLLGFLEMWALESYGAVHTLQESLTIKSDDAEGREQAAMAILTGQEVEPAGEGKSLKLLENALMGLGIRVEEER